jgi:formyltetrahydrofolate hydrolase
MILTTKHHAHNFALYALWVDPILKDLNYESLVGGLKAEIVSVFGNHTFSDEELDSIAEGAIAAAEEVE